MAWRFIPFQYYDPYVKTGLNQVSITAAETTPLFWLAGWKQNCVNIGRGQDLEHHVNVEHVQQRDDVVVVRRQGGGGTTYLTTDGEITWNMAAPQHLFPREVTAIYEQVCSRVITAVENLGITAWHEPVNDVVTPTGKVSGATVKKTGDVVYAAGTLLYDVDIEDMATVLTPSSNTNQEDKDAVEDRVTSISKHCDAAFTDVVESLADAFLQDRAYDKDQWRENEHDQARELAEVYKTREWIAHGRKPERGVDSSE